MDGSAIFDVTQLSQYYVRLGETTLTIETSGTPVPEPSTMVLIGIGLVGIFGIRRKKRI